MFFYFRVSSKDEQVLRRFLKFLNKLDQLPTVIKYFPKYNKTKLVTILKSPHVNKTAQEQFEFRFYKKEFLVNSLKPLTIFVVLKRIINSTFPGIQLEVKSVLTIEKRNLSLLKTINPDCIVLSKDAPLSDKEFIPQKKYIQLFDCYGEFYLRTLSSSKH